MAVLSTARDHRVANASLCKCPRENCSVAMIPNRQTILITGSDHLDGLDSMAEITLSATEKPRFISGIPIVLHDGN